MSSARRLARLCLGGLAFAGFVAHPASIGGTASASGAERVLLVGLGDSITHGTMNATRTTQLASSK